MTENQVFFSPIAAVVCDEIRMEASGKEIFIGVYSDQLVVHELPIVLPLQIHLLGKFNGPGQTDLSIRVFDPSEKKVLEAKAGMSLSRPSVENEIIGLTIPKFAIDIQKDGAINIECKSADEKWKAIKTLLVLYKPRAETERPSTAATAPQPPS